MSYGYFIRIRIFPNNPVLNKKAAKLAKTCRDICDVLQLTNITMGRSLQRTVNITIEKQKQLDEPVELMGTVYRFVHTVVTQFDLDEGTNPFTILTACGVNEERASPKGTVAGNSSLAEWCYKYGLPYNCNPAAVVDVDYATDYPVDHVEI
jgi:hypothetical protein